MLGNDYPIPERKPASLAFLFNDNPQIWVTPEDASLLARIMEAEVGPGWPDDYYYGVLDTILNRVASDQFPNTIEGVINQPNQFSAWAAGIVPEHASPRSHEIVNNFLTGNNTAEPHSGLFYATPEAAKSFPAYEEGPIAEDPLHQYFQHYDPERRTPPQSYDLYYFPDKIPTESGNGGA